MDGCWMGEAVGRRVWTGPEQFYFGGQRLSVSPSATNHQRMLLFDVTRERVEVVFSLWSRSRPDSIRGAGNGHRAPSLLSCPDEVWNAGDPVN